MPAAKTKLGDGRAEIDYSWTRMPGDKPSGSDTKVREMW